MSKPSPSAPHAGTRGRGPRWIWWWLLWLPTTLLAVVLSLLVALWLWAASPSSLGQTLSWLQTWLEDQPIERGRLQVEDSRGSLRHGGQIGSLRWTQPGLVVQASGIRLSWTEDLLLSLITERSLRLDALHIDRLVVADERPDSGEAPPSQVELPLRVSVPWSVDLMDIRGEGGIGISELRGHYSYDAAPRELGVAQAHRLRLDSVRWADGLYHGDLVLGAQSPMPLVLTAGGRVDLQVPEGLPQHLEGDLQARGTLAGAEALIDLDITLKQSTAPDGQRAALDARARVRPWDTRQPLTQLQASVLALDLAGLWPGAPRTALSGEVALSPRHQGWTASVSLDNPAASALDRQGLPLARLRLEMVQEGAVWDVRTLEARVGSGWVRGQASLVTGDRPLWLSPWSGRIRFEQLDPALVWSVLSPGRLDGAIEARTAESRTGGLTMDFSAGLLNVTGTPRGRSGTRLPLDELQLQGQWQLPATASAGGLVRLEQVKLRALGLLLDGKARLNLQSLGIDGQLQARAPGWSASWRGLVEHGLGHGDLTLDLTDAAAAQGWLRSLQAAPWIGTGVTDGLGESLAWDVRGKASATVQWRGGLGVLGYPGANGPERGAAQALELKLDLQAPDLQMWQAGSSPGWQVNDARLQMEGLPTDLNWQLKSRVLGPPGQLSLELQGQSRQTWPAGAFVLTSPPDTGRLRLDQFSLALQTPGPSATAWRLVAPDRIDIPWQSIDNGVRVNAGPARLLLRPGHAHQEPDPTQGATLTWSRLDWDRGALSTQGHMDGLALAWLDLLTANGTPSTGMLAQAGIHSNLLLQGQWDVHLPAGLQSVPRVQVLLQRKQGDLELQTDGLPASAGRPSVVAAGVRAALLNISTDGRKVQTRLRWDSERLGDIDAMVTTELSPPDADHSAWYWAERAPLTGQLRARLPEVGVWSALAPPGWRIQGTLDAQAEIRGDRQRPQWRGRLHADKLAVRSVVEGIALTQGSLRATLDGDRIHVEQLKLQGPGEGGEGGELQATGSAYWRPVERDGSTRQEPIIELQATANRLRVSTRPDRRLTLSGKLQAGLDGRLLDIRGQLTADSALFLLPDELTPRLAEDVVVRRHDRVVQPPASGARVQASVEVDIDLGSSFEVRGQGLTTRLGGQLTVRSTPALPSLRVLGEVRTLSGTYRAYGQQLNIESGALRFAGPYDDPSLDIVAIRPNLRQQRVGVQIAGTAQRPSVRLFSDPEMPDSDKLAWLVLGRPATGAGAEAAVLQQAALALLAGDGEGVGSRLAGFLGLDRLTMVDRGGNGDALSLSKRFSSRLYLNYERGLLSTLGTVAVFYDISRWLTLRARAGEENAIDLIFLREFD